MDDVVPNLAVASKGIDVLIVKRHRVIFPLCLARHKDCRSNSQRHERARIVAIALVGHGWSSARTLGGFALAGALLAAFAIVERQVRAPMLDISLFRNPRFTAASGSVTIAFFNLFGFIFLITQYFQFFRDYSPLSTGVHLLPVAVSIGVTSVLGTRLAVRFGTKLVVAAGLLAMAGFYVWVSTVTVSTGYATIAAQMLLYGTGMGFTSAPATEAIMGVVPAAKAGVGSAVNDATRLLGGTLGVAVIGSVYASLYASRLTATLPPHLPAALVDTAHSSAGAALAIAHQVADAELSVCIDGCPRPAVASSGVHLFFGNVLLFGIDKRPNFVALHSANGQVADCLFVVFGARTSQFF